MAISYVGGKGAGTAGQGGGSIGLTTGLAGGSGGAPIAGDLVVVTVSIGTAARQPTTAISTPTGYTPLTAQRTTATTYDTNVQTCYKVMGSTPDTEVTIPASGNNADGIAYTIQVFRGVDPTTPMDATPTYATGSGSNNRPDPAAITPVSSGAWIVVCGGGASATGTTLYTAPTGFTTNFLTYNGADNNDGTVGSGYYTGWTSGAYNPAAFTGGSTNAANSWGCTTLALRPASNNYPLTCNSGSYSYTGSSATITRNRALTSNAGSYAYTGSSADITKGAALNNRELTANSGAYTYTGQNATLSRGRPLTASAGSYSYTGQTSVIRRNRALVANSGSYAYTGSSSLVAKSKLVVAQAGSYAYTGHAASIRRNRSIVGNAGSYTYTGQSAVLNRGRALLANAGSYTYTGQSVTLFKGKDISAQPGAHSYTGSNAEILKGRSLALDAGSYAYTGSSATLNKGAALNHRSLNALAGSYAYTGSNAELLLNRYLSADSGTYAYTGSPADITWRDPSHSIIAAPGIYTITGQSIEIVVPSSSRGGGSPSNFAELHKRTKKQNEERARLERERIEQAEREAASIVERLRQGDFVSPEPINEAQPAEVPTTETQPEQRKPDVSFAPANDLVATFAAPLATFGESVATLEDVSPSVRAFSDDDALALIMILAEID